MTDLMSYVGFYRYFLSLQAFFFTVVVCSSQQVAITNSGNVLVHPNSLQQIGSDFVNTTNGSLLNNGTIWITNNFQNEGTVSFDNTLQPSPGLTRFQGTSTQIISGSGSSSFYNVLFSGVSFKLQQSIKVYKEIDFEVGVVQSEQPTPQTQVNMIEMQANSSCINPSDNSFVDGFVQKTGNSAFKFPIGHNGHYRPAAIGVSGSLEDSYVARYVYANPEISGYALNSKASGVGALIGKEYWILERKAGGSFPQVTLFWDAATTGSAIPADLKRFQVVRWDGSKWIKEGQGNVEGNTTKGSITSNITGYGIFSLAIGDEKLQVVAVDDKYDVIQGSVCNGDVSLNDTVKSGTVGNSWTANVLPQHGTVTLQRDGKFKYVSDGLYYGEDSFTYNLTNNYGVTAVAKVTFTIKPISDYLLVNKAADEPRLQLDGTFKWNYVIRITNKQKESVTSIHLQDDLEKVFESPVTFNVLEVNASGGLKANWPHYDGVSDKNVLLDVSTVPALQSDSVTISVLVNPHGFAGVVYNQAVFEGACKVTGTVSNILSDDVNNKNSTEISKPTETTIPSIVVQMPTGFSPNNDGYNDAFEIAHAPEILVNLQVFNRWGMLVYRNNDYRNDWYGKGTGTLLGSDLPDGTYFYIIDANDTLTNKNTRLTGYVTLKR